MTLNHANDFFRPESLRALKFELIMNGDRTAKQLAKALALNDFDTKSLLRELELAGEVRSIGRHFRAVVLAVPGYNAPSNKETLQ